MKTMKGENLQCLQRRTLLLYSYTPNSLHEKLMSTKCLLRSGPRLRGIKVHRIHAFKQSWKKNTIILLILQMWQLRLREGSSRSLRQQGAVAGLSPTPTYPFYQDASSCSLSNIFPVLQQIFLTPTCSSPEMASYLRRRYERGRCAMSCFCPEHLK